MSALRLASCALALATLGAAAACAQDEPVRTGESQLAKALSSDGVEIRRITSHAFRDLDGDGVKESLVHGRGNLRGASTGDALVLSFHRPPAAAGGRTVLLPSSLAWDRFVGVFRFERAAFQWRPVLVGTYRKERMHVSRLEVVEVAGNPLVHLAYQEGREARDRLFRLRPDGMDEVFSSSRGMWVGEGFWVKGAKLFTSRGLPNPFASGDRPGFLQKIRYRWRGGAFEPEYWTLGGYGFDADLDDEVAATSKNPAVRRVRELQRAADRGVAHTRLSLEDLCRRRYGDGPYRIVMERDGFAVVIQQLNQEAIPHYYVAPFFESRGEGKAVWVGLDELEPEG